MKSYLMTDPQKKPEKAPNQWLAQQESLARFHQAMKEGGIPLSTRPHPLQLGSAVITIPFSKGSSEATEK